MDKINFDRTLQYTMVAAAIILVSLIYPSNVKFKYEFQRGQEWRYADLYAPYDFPILKSEEEIIAGRKALEESVTPYYERNEKADSIVWQNCKAVLQQWVQEQKALGDSVDPPQNADKYFYFFKQKTKELLDQGIIGPNMAHADSSANFVINIIDGKSTKKKILGEYFRLYEAQKRIADYLVEKEPDTPIALVEKLQKTLMPNIIYEKARTEAAKEMMLAGYVTTKGLVKQGDLIVQRGNLITNEIYDRLYSFKTKYATDVSSIRSTAVVYGGYLIITILLFVALMMYINSYNRDLLLNWQHLGFILTWILLFSYLTFFLEKKNVFSAYLIPYCIVPIVISHFINFRLAFFAHVIVVMIVGFISGLGFPFVYMQIVAGVVAVLAVADARNWSKFFQSVLAIILAYAMAHFGISLIEEGSLMTLDWDVYGLFIFNGFLTLLAFPLIPLAEKIFGFTTAISLVELSDMNRPLLRELTQKAPGTLQHSLQVGNLSEAAAREIGADELLVRVAALYHDIGKMENPQHFIENQSGRSPHEVITAIQSAQVIIGHVEEGVKLAKKHKLPKSIIRFIKTHHGTTRADYFYKTYLQNNPGITVDAADFTYAGPKPASKEEGILMLADTLEAASRSLKSPSAESIDELVEKLIKSKIKEGQLDECALTMGDLAKCREVFKKNLKSILHVRIEYPK